MTARSRLPLEVLALGSLLAWACGILLVVAALLGGCAHAPRGASTKPIVLAAPPSSVTASGRVWTLHCKLSDQPTVPEYEPQPSAAAQPDIMMRTMVHRRDFDLLVQYNRDLLVFVGSLSVCLENLIEVAHLPEHP